MLPGTLSQKSMTLTLSFSSSFSGSNGSLDFTALSGFPPEAMITQGTHGLQGTLGDAPVRGR